MDLLEPKILTRIFHSLSTETRLKLFIAVASTPDANNVGTLAQLVNITHSAASHNLKILEDSGLILGVQGGKFYMYIGNKVVLESVLQFVQQMQYKEPVMQAPREVEKGTVSE